MTEPNPDTRALDQIRARLHQLCDSLTSLRTRLQRPDLVLRDWQTLQAATALITANLRDLISSLQTHSAFLSSAHVYPNTAFPGRTQEPLLGQLLRKKLEPTAEDWIDAGRHAAVFGADSEQNGANGVGGDAEGLLTERELDELWEWAGPAGNDVAKSVLMAQEDEEDDDLEESEEEEEEEGEEEEDEMMEDVKADISRPKAKAAPIAPQKPMMALEDIFRFASTGFEASQTPNVQR